MGNKKILFVLVGAIVFGLLAATSVTGYLRNVRNNTNPNTMVVAKVDIPLGARIIAEQLTTVEVPKAATPDGTYNKMDDVVGRISVTKISAREPITSSRLAPIGSSGGLSAVIPEGFRAMTVKVDDETGIAGFLMPGTLVDVLAVINTDNNQGAISKIVLQNIKVLANGQNLDQPKDEREANSVRTVTLQVTPEQSEKLALASSEGKLRLALRNSIDQGDEQTNGVSKRTILTGDRALPVPDAVTARNEAASTPRVTNNVPPPRSNPAWDLRPIAPQPAPPQPAPQTTPTPRAAVEVFEGGKKHTVVFP
ncbi:MAG TPA: Flp pilus assembly protein CpaB [Blastocatellia bacterium]|nr:Flp pilus assembly protein CpaB [Blastocatellia bacterium]